MLSSKKRARADSESAEFRAEDVPFGKRARATTEASADSGKWFNDSVLNTPTQAREQSKFDSDDETSSLVSEPSSPQDADMDDEDMGDTLSQSPEDAFMSRPTAINGHIMGQRLQTNRVPTPMVAMRPGASPERLRTGFKQHVRKRHPQEYSASSDLLEVPSPIDEHDVPTPPSAAEAAGSQLSMLSVCDVDMEGNSGNGEAIPRILIDPARPTNHTSHVGPHPELDMDPIYVAQDNIIVRKQRQRSGALSSANSPVRGQGPGNTATKRGFSMGFRADCEKCRNRVPGHMNHFN